jgi:hypothetical protein
MCLRPIARSPTPDSIEDLQSNPQRLREYARRYQLRDLFPDEILMRMHGEELEKAFRDLTAKGKIGVQMY